MNDWFDSSYNLYADPSGIYTGDLTSMYGNGGGGAGGNGGGDYTTYSDGSTEYVDQYGDSYYYGSDGSQSVTYADGSQQYTDPSGNVTYVDATTGLVSGSQTDASGGTLEDYGDGTYGYTDAQGNYTFYAADGSQTTQLADGSIEYTGADGTYSFSGADGSQETYGPDGSYSYSNANYSYTQDAAGNWSEIQPDGTKCAGDATGWCCNDGSCGGAWANKATNYGKQPMGPSGGGAGAGGSIGGGGAKPQGQPQQPPQPQPRPAAPVIPRNPTIGPFIPGTMIQTPAAGLQVGGTNIPWVWVAIAGVALLAFSGGGRR